MNPICEVAGCQHESMFLWFGKRVCNQHYRRHTDPTDGFTLYEVFDMPREDTTPVPEEKPQRADTVPMQGRAFLTGNSKRFPDFGKELRRDYDVPARCYDCSNFYDGCPAYDAAKHSYAKCRNYYPLPDVLPGTYGQKFPEPSEKKPAKPCLVEKPRSTIRSGLRGFIQHECAEQCPECYVLGGHSCPYFEKVVLGPPDYKYRTPGYDYDKLFAEYAAINPVVAAGGVQIRRCQCGETLPPRKRLCDKCRLKKRQTAYRKCRDSNTSNLSAG